MASLCELYAASPFCLIRSMRRGLRHRQSFRHSSGKSISRAAGFHVCGDVQFGGCSFVRQGRPGLGVHLRSQAISFERVVGNWDTEAKTLASSRR